MKADGITLCILALIFSANTLASSHGLGRPATPEEIRQWDIDVMPDGRGAPPGEGDYTQGKTIYTRKCAACHGDNMAKPVKGTGAPALIGGRGTLNSNNAVKTVESYWPYATTLFDYIKRAMPFNAPGSLNNNEVYSLCAYILAEAHIIDKTTPLNAITLAKIKMPNRNGFIPDPRPEHFEPAPKNSN